MACETLPHVSHTGIVAAPVAPSNAPRISLARGDSVPSTALVTIVPFELYHGYIYLQTEIDGYRGMGILDIGAPAIVLNGEYIRHVGATGIDTLRAEATSVPAEHTDTTGRAPHVIVRTVRLGSLLHHLDTTNVGPPIPYSSTNADVARDPRFSPQILGRPLLGLLGLPMWEAFETIIDYAHQRVILIRLDATGHRLAAVPEFTPSASLPLVPARLSQNDSTYWWGIVGHLDGNPNGITDTLVLDTGAPYNSMDDYTRGRLDAQLTPDSSPTFWTQWVRAERFILRRLVVGEHGNRTFDGLSFTNVPQRDVNILGYPFLSRLGVVGFNFRTRQLITYQQS